MKFLLIIWIYQSSVYYEVKMPTMAECRKHENIAHTWGIPIVTQCVKETPPGQGNPDGALSSQ